MASCSRVSGTYVNEGGGLYDQIEFVGNSSCTITTLGMKFPAAYRIDNGYVYIHTHDGGDTLKAGNRSTRGLSVRPSADKEAPYPLQVTVREGKEAWRKGVRTGDYILEYNGVPIRDICTYILLKKQDKDSAYKFISPDGTVKEVVFNE